jgi:hypothetical protein
LKLTIPDDLINPVENSRGKKKQVKPEVKDSTVRTLFDMAKKGVNFVKNSFLANDPQPKKLNLRKEKGPATPSSISDDSPVITESMMDDSQNIEGYSFGDDSQNGEDFSLVDDDPIDMEAFDIQLQKQLMEQYSKKESPVTIVIDDDDSQQSIKSEPEVVITPVKKEERQPKKLNLKRKVEETPTTKQPPKKKAKVTPPVQKSTLMSFWKK